MKKIKVQNLWTPLGWVEDTVFELNSQNKILYRSIERSSSLPLVRGWVIPSFKNSHSHAFQYAMGGLSENLKMGHTQDDFWSWRENMYQLALTITPDKMLEIATSLYKNMKKSGYGHVTEFHYLHNDVCGNRYSNPAEMAETLIEAARRVGIGITVVPVFYKNSDFDTEALLEQRRFISRSVSDYVRLVDAVEQACREYERARVGIGVHSLRAASQNEVKEIFGYYQSTTVPKHIHISEQTKEVQACQLKWGVRPVEWLLENVNLNSSFHLVHATHMVEEEILGTTRSKAHVVLCPTTEANLGDGIFPLGRFLEEEGSWSIGSDSHICISPMEELRWLDYAQRLSQQKRNTVCQKGGEDSGELLFAAAFRGGVSAAGLNITDELAEGSYFDALHIEPTERFSHGQTERILSTLIFAGNSCDVKLLTE